MNKIYFQKWKQIIGLSLFIFIIFWFGGEYVFAATPLQSPECQVEGVVKSVRFVPEWEHSCVADNTCYVDLPTDFPRSTPAGYYINIDIDSAVRVGGVDYSSCSDSYFFPVGGRTEIFVYKSYYENGKQVSSGQKIRGIAGSYTLKTFESYDIIEPKRIVQNVKCIFNSSNTTEECWAYNSDGKMYSFKGVGSAGGQIVGYEDEVIKVKSSCQSVSVPINVSESDQVVAFECGPDYIPALNLNESERERKIASIIQQLIVLLQALIELKR